MSQQDSSLNFGLNARHRRTKLSAFQDEDSSSSDVEEKNLQLSQGRRQIVNKELSKDQLALRKRNEQDLSSNGDIFDYDSHYESFSSLHHQQSQLKPDTYHNTNPSTEKKESRYISSLLHHSKLRQQEREIVMERKIAKVQAAEESKEEFQGKDRFITNAFKRKLQEREEWLKNDEVQRKKEEEDDVTKKVAGENIWLAGFYGNLQKNPTIMDTPTVTTTIRPPVKDEPIATRQISSQPSSFTESAPKFGGRSQHGGASCKPEESVQSLPVGVTIFDVDSIRSNRLIKVLCARKRYLDQRKNL